MLATDRLVVKLYAQRVSGPTNITVTVYFEGSTHASHVQTTISAGAVGPEGPAGPGVPAGGTAGQVLSKIDGSDYNTAWIDPAGGSSTWVPEDAVIHIDFIGGSPQGRAWVLGSGEVAIDTLLGSDANATAGRGPTEYDPAGLTEDGYVYPTEPPAFIGALRTMVLDAATVVVTLKQILPTAVTDTPEMVLLSADGDFGLNWTLKGQNPPNIVMASSEAGELNTQISGVVNVALDALNRVAATITATRFDLAANGSAAVAGTLDEWDRPAEYPYVAVVLDTKHGGPTYALQSITVYNPLVDTTGLSELSELPVSYAPIDSPTFTGDPKAPTPPAGDNDTSIATTAFVTTAAAAKEPTIAPGTTAQYWRGDKSWQMLDKTAVGLANVDNTSDANKPVSTAQAAADALRLLKAGDTMTGYLTLVGNPNTSNHAANKAYVDSADTALDTAKVAKAGDTMSGALTINASQPMTIYTVGGSQKAFTYYASDNSGFLIQIPTGPAIKIITATGSVEVGNGIITKAGYGGSYGGNTYNFNWTGSLQAWVDNTNLGTISFTCDYRAKRDVEPLASTWDQVKALKPITFRYRDYGELFTASDEPQWGFLAHELQESLLPSAATGSKDEENMIQSPNLLAIIAGLTRALQEAMTRVEALEASHGR
jgi:hypothetical protein